MWHVIKRILLVGVVLVALSGGLTAQVPKGKKPRPRPRAESPAPASQDTMRADTVSWKELPPDTVRVMYYYAGMEPFRRPFADTLLDDYFTEYDPARGRGMAYLHLGNTGSAARPVAYPDPARFRLDLGIPVHDLYFYSLDSLRYYHLGRALSDAYFSYAGKENLFFKARLAKQFQDGFQLSLQYRKINHLGQYPAQTARVSALLAGIQYQKSTRYRAYLTLALNDAKARENGGLTTDSLFFAPGFERPETQPVYLHDAISAHRHYRLRWQQFYRPVHSGKTFIPELENKIWVGTESYLFYDQGADLMSGFFGDYVTDDRGVRQYLGYRVMGISGAVAFKGVRADSTEFEWLPAPGIEWVRYQVNQEPLSFTRNHVNLTGRWDNRLGRMEWHAQGRVRLAGDDAGDYLLTGHLLLPVWRQWKIRLDARLQAKSPELLLRNAFVTQIPVWHNDFRRRYVNQIGGTLAYNPFLSAGLSVATLTYPVYYDALSRPRQFGGTVGVVRAHARIRLSLGSFHLHSYWLFQQTGAQFIRRPGIYAVQRLYWQRMLFQQALDAKIGFTQRYYSRWTPEAYQPLFGNFYLQDTYVAGPLSAWDVAAAFRVRTFRFFAKMENLQYYFTDKIYFETALYPMMKPRFRLGISWLFRG